MILPSTLPSFARVSLALSLTWLAACTAPLVASTPQAPVHPDPVQAPKAEETRAPAPLRVASWNLHRYGHIDRSNPKLAAVMQDYDLVAIQELMTKAAAEALLEDLPGYAVLYTDDPRPLEARYREYYAFFYRADRLTPTFNSYVPDPDDLFRREPFLGCFSFEADPHDLCVVNVHVVWGHAVAERKAEILALDDAIRWAQSARDNAHWIVLGDFNRVLDTDDRDLDPEPEWAELLDRHALQRPLAVVGEDGATTISDRRYANRYDHVFVSTELSPRVRAAGRRDLVNEVCEGDYERCRDTYSDHAPVWVELDATEN